MTAPARLFVVPTEGPDFRAWVEAQQARVRAEWATRPCRGINPDACDRSAPCDRRGRGDCPLEVRGFEARTTANEGEDRLRRGRVPEVLWPFALGAGHDTEARRLVRKWLAGTRRGLVLWGATGRGKSAAAAEAVARLGGTWIAGPDLAALADWSERWESLRAAPLVVLDDPDRALDQRRAQAATDRLVSLAADGRRRLVVTTNLTASGWWAWLTDRARSRLVAMCGGDAPPKCGGADLRRPGGTP